MRLRQERGFYTRFDRLESIGLAVMGRPKSILQALRSGSAAVAALSPGLRSWTRGAQW